MDYAQAQKERDHNIVVAHQHVEGVEEPEHHHEKKSVMKKVKAKAKKIKDTIAKKVHHDDHSSDSGSEYDDQDETVQDPEIHGAPIYDSATTRSSVFGAPPPVDLSPPGPAYEDPHKTDHGKLDSREKLHSVSFGETVTGDGLHAPHDLPATVPHYTAFTPTTTAPLPGQVEYEKETHINVNNPRRLQEHDHDKMVLDRELHLAPKHDIVLDSSGIRDSAFGPSRTRQEDLPPPGVSYQGQRQRSSDLGKIDSKERHGVNFGESAFVGEGMHAPQNTPAVPFSHRPGQVEHQREPKVGLDFPKMLEEDPAAPKHALDARPTTNYQTKVVDPTGKGGEVAGMGPILHSLDRMTIHEERNTGREQNFPSETRSSSTNQPFSTGSHEQFSTGPTFPGREQNLPSETHISSTNQPFGSRDHFSFAAPTFPGREQNLPSETHISSTNQPFGSRDHFSSAAPNFPGREQNLPSETRNPSSSLPFSAASHDRFSSEPTFPRSKQDSSFSTGTHDQFCSAQENFPSKTHNASSNIPFLATNRDRFSSEPMAPEGYIPDDSTPVSGLTNTPETQDIGIGKASSNEGSGISGKISSATSAIAGTAVSAKNIVASKMGYGENRSPRSELRRDDELEVQNQNPSNQSSYTDKISSATSTIADKAVSAKNAVASKIGYGENQNQAQNPSNQNQGGYTDTITSAASAVADKAAAAKNIVASKIGYGEKTSPRYEKEEKLNHNEGGYTEKISSATSAIADKAASAKNTVVSTVSGAGSAVMSKIPGVGSGSAAEEKTGETGPNRGGTVKEYFVEKLRPGEEDKALSDVISGTLHKGGEESRPRGKVKESVEVRRRLGPFNEKDEERVRRGMENTPGTGVADKLYGAVTSWFSKDEDVETMDQQANAASGNEGISGSTNEDATMRKTNLSGEKRLQEN